MENWQNKNGKSAKGKWKIGKMKMENRLNENGKSAKWQNGKSARWQNGKSAKWGVEKTFKSTFSPTRFFKVVMINLFHKFIGAMETWKGP